MTKTYLIIGAGAHVEIGMPSGSDLTKTFLLYARSIKQYERATKSNFANVVSLDAFKQIAGQGFIQDKFSTDLFNARANFCFDKIIETIATCGDATIQGNYPVYFYKFLESFRLSGQTSVDSFLSSEGFKEGKIFNAFLGLFIFFSQEFALENNINPVWINGLLTNNSIELWSQRDDLEIITFNYDVIFEKLIYGYLRLQTGLDESSAIDELAKIPIHHVYGRIPDLEIFNQDKEIRSVKSQFFYDKYANDQKFLIDYFQLEGAGIKTIRTSDQVELGLIVEKAKSEREKFRSYRFIFLGFGFDVNNLKLLFSGIEKPENLPKNGISSFTTGVCTSFEFESYKKRVDQYFNLGDSKSGVGTNCHDLLFNIYGNLLHKK